MTRLRSLIKEVLSTSPKKKDCNCGCGGCDKKSPIITEGKIKPLISEGLTYHVENKIPLHESVYRIGSEKHFDLINEARTLWVRGLIDVSEDDQAILETNLGHFGMYEGEKVPLDMPMVNEENTFPDSFTVKDTLHYTPEIDGKPKKLLKGTYFLRNSQGDTAVYFNQAFKSEVEIDNDDVFNFKRLKSNIKINEETVDWPGEFMYGGKRYVFFKQKDGRVTYEHEKYKGDRLTFGSKKEMDDFLGDYSAPKGGTQSSQFEESLKESVNENLMAKFQDALNDDQFAFFQRSLDKAKRGEELNQSEEQVVKYFGMVKSKYDDAIAKGISPDEISLNPNKPIDEAKKKKKKDPPIGKPKRGGSKAYYVYVRDPKTKKIKKVSFGSGGLRAKIKNKEARNAFAARHNCKNKKDRTKAGYWSCNLPRYAEQLGLGSKMNTFW